MLEPVMFVVYWDDTTCCMIDTLLFNIMLQKHGGPSFSLVFIKLFSDWLMQVVYGDASIVLHIKKNLDLLGNDRPTALY
jgi:hypothetical protein